MKTSCLGKSNPASIKMSITSRPLPRIEQYLKDQAILQVMLKQGKVEKDIAVYVDYHLEHAGLNNEVRLSVKQAVGDKHKDCSSTPG